MHYAFKEWTKGAEDPTARGHLLSIFTHEMEAEISKFCDYDPGSHVLLLGPFPLVLSIGQMLECYIGSLASSSQYRLSMRA